MRHLTVYLTLLFVTGCLHVPDPPAPDAAVRDASADGGGPSIPPFSVTGWAVRDPSGRPWPPEAAPRAPILRVELGHRPASEPDEGPPIWLFEGAPDEDLADDLSRAPLRIATRARIVPCAVAIDGAAVELSPHARLRPGGSYAVAVAPWIESELTGEKLPEPWMATLSVSDAPEAGAAVAASWPADGAAAVAPSIPALAIRFDGPVERLSGGLGLFEGERALAVGVAAVDCREVGWPDGWCARLVPAAPLARGAAHRIAVGDAVVDATGAPVGPWEARFTTSLEPDGTPPALLATSCALDEIALPEGCLFVDDGRFELALVATEAVRVRLAIAGRELLAVAARGEATLGADGLPPATALDGILRLEDLAGLASSHSVLVETLPPLPTLAIVEVRADPEGDEPGQEYVEILNFGTVTVDLAGLHLSDRPDALGDAIERPVLLTPGQRALLVADGFDPDAPEDVPVPPGALLVRMGTSLATGGLTNAGEPLFLRDAEGHRLSAAPALPAPDEGQCIVRVGDAMRAATGFVGGPCTPGTGP